MAGVFRIFLVILFSAANLSVSGYSPKPQALRGVAENGDRPGRGRGPPPRSGKRVSTMEVEPGRKLPGTKVARPGRAAGDHGGRAAPSRPRPVIGAEERNKPPSPEPPQFADQFVQVHRRSREIFFPFFSTL